jgi:hypothetical protein
MSEEWADSVQMKIAMIVLTEDDISQEDIKMLGLKRRHIAL